MFDGEFVKSSPMTRREDPSSKCKTSNRSESVGHVEDFTPNTTARRITTLTSKVWLLAELRKTLQNGAGGKNYRGGGGGFYYSGKSGRNYGGTTGKGGEGGKGYLDGALGGGATIKDVVGGFGGGGGGVHKYSQGGGGGGYSGGRSGANAMNSCGGGGRSFNARKNQINERCCKISTHGQVTITFLLDF
ncbi:unnamed protein product [Pocillopora meandrina]|uniref:Uncharacterized protein n=1 Tax=Pocillopora meandrina TaxID=46732 RepID=A0AAU9XT98_9CNID|nr:unnamed protein product [Pocillopora meandrina]